MATRNPLAFQVLLKTLRKINFKTPGTLDNIKFIKLEITQRIKFPLEAF